MKNWMRTLGLATISIALVACVGSSFETENTVLGSVSRTDGMPAARVKIVVRPDNYLPGTDSLFADTLETDELGNFEFKPKQSGTYLVEARGDSLKGVAKLNYDKDFGEYSELNMLVEKPGTVAGRVVLPEGVTSLSIGIQGLEYQVETDSIGKFEFESLPAGKFEVIAFVRGKKADEVTKYGSTSVGIEAGASESVVIGNYLMLDDFEGSLDWYVNKTEYATADLGIVDAGGDREGKAAHFVCTNDSALGWVLMGRYVGNEIDMSGMDSVVFWARAQKKGEDDPRLWVSFDANGDTADTGKAWLRVMIDSVWTRYVVLPDSFDVPDSNHTGGNIGWDEVKKRVTNISLFGGVGGEFWIDDIEIFGVPPRNFDLTAEDPNAKKNSDASSGSRKEN